jgi:hypothetical protein
MNQKIKGNSLNAALMRMPLAAKKACLNRILRSPLLFQGRNKERNRVSLQRWRYRDSEAIPQSTKVLLWVLISEYQDINISELWPDIFQGYE